jgi:hypothetical protein
MILARLRWWLDGPISGDTLPERRGRLSVGIVRVCGTPKTSWGYLPEVARDISFSLS